MSKLNEKLIYVRVDKFMRKINGQEVPFIDTYLLDLANGSLVDRKATVTREDGSQLVITPHYRTYLSDEVAEKLEKLGQFPFLLGFDPNAVVTDKEGRKHRQFFTPLARDSAGAIKTNKKGEQYRVIFINGYSFAEPTERPLAVASFDALSDK